MALSNMRLEAHPPAWFALGRFRQAAEEKGIENALISRIENIAAGYGEQGQKASPFINAMTSIVRLSDEELVLRILNGMGRADGRSLFTTALAIDDILSYRPGRKHDMDTLARVQSVMDRYHGSAAHSIGLFLSRAVNKGQSAQFDALCEAFGSEEMVSLAGRIEEIEEGAPELSWGKRRNANGYFFANSVGFVVLGTMDLEIALDAGRMLKETYEEQANRNPERDEKWFVCGVVGEVVSSAAMVCGPAGAKKAMGLGKSLGGEDFYGLCYALGLYEAGCNEGALKKFVDNDLDKLFADGINGTTIGMTKVFL